MYLPDGYTLNSAKRMDVAILSDNFPRKKDREFDLSRLTQITYFVAGTIPTGRHAFRFPVYWAANQRLEISNFNFKFPRARNLEMIGLVLGCMEAKFWK